jgi:hypothetical protein
MIGMKTTQHEIVKFRDSGARKAIIYLESARRKEIQNCVLYRYEFNPANFQLMDRGAGYYVSESQERPINRVEISDLLTLLNDDGVRIYWISDIRKYAYENATSNYRFSNIRMTFAKIT